MKLSACLLALLPALAIADVRYTLQPQPASGAVRVSMSIDSTSPTTTFRIPAWCPGFYFLLKYQDKITNFTARDSGGKQLEVRRGDDPRAWTVVGGAGEITVSYSVTGDDAGLGFFAVNVRPDKAFVNGPAAFMYVDGRLAEPTTLKVDLPAGWDVATGLERNDAGDFMAGGYDELLDSPLQLGKFERRKFTVEGYPFEAIWVSVDNTYRMDIDAESKRLAQLSAPALKLFKGLSGFKRYVYIIHLAVGSFGGGLEHRASTTLAVPNSNFHLDTLATHEFFHSWNVKQLRPKALGPFDYTKENRTRNLWMSEGVTDYYAQITAYRSGLMDADGLFQALSQYIGSLQRGQTRLSKTVEDASWEAWENGGFGLGDLSYYTKGALLGLTFDGAIRDATRGKKSLDDLMRGLFDHYRLPKPGFGEDDLRLEINRVADKDLSELYTRMARTTQEMPYEVLKGIGLRVLAPNVAARTPGFKLDGAVVTSVSQGSDLKVGDKLLRANGSVFDGAILPSFGDSFSLVVERGGQQVLVRVQVSTFTPERWTLEPDPFASKEARQRLGEFLAR